MISHLLALILSPLLVVAALVARPVVATCPRGWIAAGVPPHGRTTCRLAAPGPADRSDPATWPARPELPLRIFCERPLVPLVRDDRRIACALEPGSRSGQHIASGEGGISP